MESITLLTPDCQISQSPSTACGHGLQPSVLQNTAASPFLGRASRYREQMQVILHRNPTIFFATKFTEPFGASCILLKKEGIRTTGGKSEHVKPSSTFMPLFSWNLIRSIAKHAAGTYCPTGSFCKGDSSEADGNQVLLIMWLKHGQDKDASAGARKPQVPATQHQRVSAYVPSVLASLQA